MHRVLRWTAGIATFVLFAASAEASPQPRAAGGRAVLATGITAPATVVGEMDRVRPIDAHAYRGQLRVERSLAGPFSAGAMLDIVWEELAAARAVRFQNHERVLIVLVQLPSGSLWLSRVPVQSRTPTWVAVADHGEAFVRDPDSKTADRVAEFLALRAQPATSAARVAALAALVADATEPVATEAVQQLNVANLDMPARSFTCEALSATLANETRPLTLRLQLLRLIADQHLAALRPALAAATSDAALHAAALAALADFDGGLPSDQVLVLLGSRNSEERALGARGSTGVVVDDQLPRLALSDAAAAVRIAAVETLVARRGADALTQTLPALGDRDGAVRRATAAAFSKLGAKAAKRIEDFALQGTFEQAEGAILTLDFMGPSGVDGLRRIAARHADSRVRVLADLALGKLPPEH